MCCFDGWGYTAVHKAKCDVHINEIIVLVNNSIFLMHWYMHAADGF